MNSKTKHEASKTKCVGERLGRLVRHYRVNHAHIAEYAGTTMQYVSLVLSGKRGTDPHGKGGTADKVREMALWMCRWRKAQDTVFRNSLKRNYSKDKADAEAIGLEMEAGHRPFLYRSITSAMKEAGMSTRTFYQLIA